VLFHLVDGLQVHLGGVDQVRHPSVLPRAVNPDSREPGRPCRDRPGQRHTMCPASRRTRSPRMARPPKSPPASSRQQRLAEMQRKEKGAQRRRLSMLWVSLVLIIAVVAGLVVWAIASRPTLEGAVEVYEPVGTTAPVLSRNHVTTTVEYEQTPPVGGDHHPAWWNCGVSVTPIPNPPPV